MLIICKQECLDVYLNSTTVQISCYKRVDNRLLKKLLNVGFCLDLVFFRCTFNSERNPNQMQRTSTQQKAAVLLSKAS